MSKLTNGVRATVRGVGATAKGLGTTFRVLFRKRETIPYPEQKKPRAARFRGRHELRRYADGTEMCIGCELCQVVCPANAITVHPAENDPGNPNSPGERYAYRWEVDLLRCIFCGMCEDACPTNALHLTQQLDGLSNFSRESLVWNKEMLTTPGPSEFTTPKNVYPDFTGRKSEADK